jgi:hypothetical protein
MIHIQVVLLIVLTLQGSAWLLLTSDCDVNPTRAKINSPSNLVSHHSVQHRNKLTHAGCQRYLFVFSLVDELAVKRMDNWIALCRA